MKLFKKNFYIIGEKPQTDWRRILITATILALGATIYGFVFYRQIASISGDVSLPVVSVDTTATTTAVKATSNGEKLELNQIIELYLSKKANYEKMISELKKS